MSKPFVWLAGSAIAVAFLLPAHVVRGQNARGAEVLHGQGVHAYFAGNTSDAERYLSEAIALNPNDPCLFYFRALSLLRMGRTAEARGDMVVGARLEAERPGAYAVGRALERVQGRNRLQLEQYRRQARVESGATGRRGGPAPSQTDAGVLRQPVTIPLGEYLRPGVPQPGAASPPASSVQPRTFAPQGAAAGDSRDDPFRDDPQPAQPPAATPQPSAPATPPAEAPLAEDNNPFGASTGSDDEAEASPEETSDEPPAAEAEDPFSSSPF